MNKFTLKDLQYRQSLPLEIKVRMTKLRIREWVQEYSTNGVYVSFSGGKDSTVLLHIVRELYPSIPAVFCDTGLEYPEIREFVRTFENVEWIKPRLNFKKVIEEYGYPVISKDVAQCVFDVSTQARVRECDKRETSMWDRAFNPESEYAKKYPTFSRYRYDYLNDAPFKISHKCCDIMKKQIAKEYEKETGRKVILGTMAQESRLRQTQWFEDGCNAFDSKRPKSKPMSFWTEQDVLKYIKHNNIKIASVYGDVVYVDDDGNEYENIICDEGVRLKTTGADRTGCMFCLFGCSVRGWDNLVRIKETHPKQYDFIMRPSDQGGLNYKAVIDWMNENGNLNIKY